MGRAVRRRSTAVIWVAVEWNKTRLGEQRVDNLGRGQGIFDRELSKGKPKTKQKQTEIKMNATLTNLALRYASFRHTKSMNSSIVSFYRFISKTCLLNFQYLPKRSITSSLEQFRIHRLRARSSTHPSVCRFGSLHFN
jgi:hypothetical protein